MPLSKSIDFLNENAGDVIKYRLHTEILQDVNKTEQDSLFEKVLQTPNYKLVESYVKPNGYIGRGMHSWDNWAGEVLHETPLQDGETAARLLANYAIPKDSKIVRNFVEALNNDEILQKEFSYIPPEIVRYRDRNVALRNGGSLSVLLYTMQALLGYGDDERIIPFVDISYKAFESVLDINALSDITETRNGSKQKYKYPYIQPDVYFPCQYHLETLANSTVWKNKESSEKLSKAINHLNRIMRDDNELQVKVGSKYYVPLWAYVRPFRSFEDSGPYHTAQRKYLTCLAKVGGSNIDVVKQTAENILEALDKDGILKVKFESPYQKKCFKQGMLYPTPYAEVGLEPAYKNDTRIWCDLTFWAVQFLHILGLDQ